MNGVKNEQIQDQINKLFSSILVEQQKSMTLKGPDDEKSKITETILKDYEKARGRGFFFNYVSSGKGHGPFTELEDGSVKYDLITSMGVNLLGHSHPLFIKAALESACTDTIMCGNLLTYKEAHKACRKIVDIVSETTKLRHFWFCGSGSFANDSALKMIWQKKQPHYRLLAFEKAFAGRSIATQDITYNSSYREGMPKSVQVDHVPHFDQQNPEGAIEKTLKSLNEYWEKNKGEYCALMIELIQGEGGFVYGTKEYYEVIFKWAKEKDVYIWVDEVQSFGRTTELFSFQAFELEEYVDIVTVGKALQCCGVLFSEELNPKPGLIAGTFNGSIISLNAAEKVLTYLTEGNFYGKDGRISEIEKRFMEGLRHLANSTCKNKIGYIGGIGTMISFEVGDSSKEVTMNFLKELFKKGIIAFSAGHGPFRVRFLIPLTITDQHIDEIMKILEETIVDTIEA